MKVAVLDLEVEVDKVMIDDPLGIYKADFRFEFSRDGDYQDIRTIYCHLNHDQNISSLVTKYALGKKRIKKISISHVSRHGESMAIPREIKKWKITK